MDNKMRSIGKRQPEETQCRHGQDRAAHRINILAGLYGAEHYLELNAYSDETFASVTMPRKTLVAPHFLFPTQSYAGTGCDFILSGPDNFFASTLKNNGQHPTFDIIFIKNQRSFANALRLFKSSLNHAHADSIWLLDNTLPASPYTSLLGQICAHAWLADTFKAVLAIHDSHPEISYCTVADCGPPQTILWRAANADRTPFFSSPEEIENLDHRALPDIAALLMPISEMLLSHMIGLALTPAAYLPGYTWQHLIQTPPTISRRIALEHQRGAAKKPSADSWPAILRSMKNKLAALLPWH